MRIKILEIVISSLSFSLTPYSALTHLPTHQTPLLPNKQTNKRNKQKQTNGNNNLGTSSAPFFVRKRILSGGRGRVQSPDRGVCGGARARRRRTDDRHRRRRRKPRPSRLHRRLSQRQLPSGHAHLRFQSRQPTRHAQVSGTMRPPLSKSLVNVFL